MHIMNKFDWTAFRWIMAMCILAGFTNNNYDIVSHQLLIGGIPGVIFGLIFSYRGKTINNA